MSCERLIAHALAVEVEDFGAQTIFNRIMGVRHAHVKLLPLHPVATATMANIVNYFFLLHTTQLPENIIWHVQYNWVWWSMSPALVAAGERKNNTDLLWAANCGR